VGGIPPSPSNKMCLDKTLDKRTDGQNCISISRVSVLTRDENAVSTNILLRRVLSTHSDVINTVPSDGGKLVTLTSGVCVQHSSETRVTVLLRRPFVVDDAVGDR